MAEETPKNPLDAMDDDASSENGATQHSDAPSEGGEVTGEGSGEQTDQRDGEGQSNGQENTTPDAGSEPREEVPSQDQEESAPPAPPQHTAPRAAASRGGEDFGISYGRRKRDIAEYLQKQPKVAFMIPRAEGESEGLAYETVQINGHRMEIKKGVMVNIPQQVAEILSNKYNVQLQAGAEKRADRSQDVMDQLS